MSSLISKAQRLPTVIPSSHTSRFQDSILHYLEIGNEISCHYRGIRNTPVKNFRKFKEMVKTFSTDSLVRLAEGNYDLSLRIYAIWGLAIRNYDSLEIVAAPLLQIQTEINYSCGCIGGVPFPANQFIYFLLAGELDLDLRKLSNRKLRDIRSQYNISPQKEILKITGPTRSGINDPDF